MNPKFETILNRRQNGSMKWDASYIKKRFHIDITEQDEIFPMFIADMDYEMEKGIQDKLVSFVKEGDFGYFNIQDSYYQSILNWHEKVHHHKLEKEWIIPSIGTITSLHLACDLFVKEAGILIFTPVYGSFKGCTSIGKQVSISLKLDHQRYYLDFEEIEEVFQKQSIQVLLFCNPHNPSGRMWNYEELERLVLLCKKYKVMIFSDEIHSDIKLMKQDFVSMIDFHEVYDQILVSTSPNKCFNISGLETSYLLCANEEMRQSYQAYLNRLHLKSNRLGLVMSEIVYTYGYDWLMQLNENIKENIEIVKRELAKSDIEIMMPDCGYLLWMKLPKVTNTDTFVFALAKESKVLLETGTRFLADYEGYIRINVATSKAIVMEAMKRFAKFYQNYNE